MLSALSIQFPEHWALHVLCELQSARLKGFNEVKKVQTYLIQSDLKGGSLKSEQSVLCQSESAEQLRAELENSQ